MKRIRLIALALIGALALTCSPAMVADTQYGEAHSGPGQPYDWLQPSFETVSNATMETWSGHPGDVHLSYADNPHSFSESVTADGSPVKDRDRPGDSVPVLDVISHRDSTGRWPERMEDGGITAAEPDQLHDHIGSVAVMRESSTRRESGSPSWRL